MKKLLIILLFVVMLIVNYILQVNFFSNFTIAGIVPNLFIIFILFVSLYSNSYIGQMFAVITGLMLDFLYGNVVGVTPAMLCVIAYLAGYFDKNFSKESKITILLMVLGSTIIFEFGRYFLLSAIEGYKANYLVCIKIILIEALYNVLLTIIIYPFMQKIGYAIDRVFKKENILTRYF